MPNGDPDLMAPHPDQLVFIQASPTRRTLSIQLSPEQAKHIMLDFDEEGVHWSSETRQLYKALKAIADSVEYGGY